MRALWLVFLCFGAVKVTAAESQGMVAEALYARCYNQDLLAEEVPTPIETRYSEVSKHRLDLGDFQVNLVAHLPSDSPKVAIYFYGNAMTVDHLDKHIEFAGEQGLNFVGVDYPCFGDSTGTPSEVTLTQAAVAAMSWISETIPGAQIQIWGRSLGTGVAMQAFKAQLSDPTVQVSKLVLVSPFNSFSKLCRSKAPPGVGLLACGAKDHKYDSGSVAPDVNVETLVIYTESDEAIKPKLTEDLVKRFPEDLVQVHISENKDGHNGIYTDSTFERIADFLR